VVEEVEEQLVSRELKEILVFKGLRAVVLKGLRVFREPQVFKDCKESRGILAYKGAQGLKEPLDLRVLLALKELLVFRV
jgi:hypothetical protein